MIRSITLNTNTGSVEVSWGMIREITMRKGYNEDRINPETLESISIPIVELTIRLQIPLSDYETIAQVYLNAPDRSPE